MQLKWKHLRSFIESFGVRLLAWLVPRLSRKGCMRLANFMGAVAFHFDQKGREVTVANLAAVFGDKYTPEQRYAIGRSSYQNFARTMVDLFWTPRFKDPANHRYLILEGAPNLRERNGRCAVVLLSHRAGFEMTAQAAGLQDLCGTVLTQAFKNEVVGKIFTDLRETFGQKIITQEASMLKMLKTVKRGGFVGMLMDLNVMPSQASTIIDAFGMKMCVTILHAVLAQRADALLIPMTTEPLADGSTRVELHPPLQVPENATIQEITQVCWNFLEPLIFEKPHLWMWSYKHFRFKPRGSTREYPFYANHSGRFEKLLKSILEEKAQKAAVIEG